MKSHVKELWFEIPSRMDFVNITRDIEDAVVESEIRESESQEFRKSRNQEIGKSGN